MWSMSFRSRAVVCVVAITCLSGLPRTDTGAAALLAQGKAEIDRDVQELRQYRLTMEKVRQMAAATLAYAQALERNPKAQARRQREKEIAALEAKPANRMSDGDQKKLEDLRARQEADDVQAARQADEPEPKTLGEMARRIEREPELSTAIRGVGLTSREFSLITLAFYQAMFVHGMKKAGTIADVPKDILPDNLAFIASNEVELNRLLAQLESYEAR